MVGARWIQPLMLDSRASSALSRPYPGAHGIVATRPCLASGRPDIGDYALPRDTRL